jgi:hypothetical protein
LGVALGRFFCAAEGVHGASDFESKCIGCNNVKAIAPEQPKLSESESSEESTSSSTTSSPSSDSDDQLSPTVDEYF